MKILPQSKPASVLIGAFGLALFVGLIVHELLHVEREFVLVGWIGAILVPIGVLLRLKIPAVGFGVLCGGLLAAMIFAAPTNSSAIPLATLFVLGISYPSRAIRPTSWIGLVLGCWLISLGVANGFNRNWLDGAPLALLQTVTPDWTLSLLLNPDAALRQSIFTPELFTETYRLDSARYRLFILGSIFGPIAVGCAFLTNRSRTIAAIAFIPVAIVVGWSGWDPALIFMATCGALTILILPRTWNNDRGTIELHISERIFVLATLSMVILWPHIQRYLAVEYNVDSHAYYAQNDHGTVVWPSSTMIRVLRDGQSMIVSGDESISLRPEIENFEYRVSRSGEFVARAPLARQLVQVFPDEPEIQISTVRYILDPRHQRVARRGRDFTFTKRSDGRYFRSIHRYTRRFLIDDVRGYEIPKI